ncbi:[LSU ribosomal protein L11P]-lysine N-methyltransferase [Marinococcus luteus]|uniref:[LSU ribosomal protein L11P]-lysine N-methyltransferase n=1 Tax=Marinococcus luteus TaxID=1122204 RepID=A0A1H2V993_9BACI|nr:50S ribosomal protein L11 methyltransferase [Marinococcus luteus]SDW64883.1 [LSU ribosomal protein L11P]-lysine N-methyltransferase [Marinococcus luteus]
MWYSLEVPSGDNEAWSLRLYEHDIYTFYVDEAIQTMKDEDGYTYEFSSGEKSRLYVYVENTSKEELSRMLGVHAFDLHEWEPPEWTESSYENVRLANGWELVYPPFQEKQGERELRLDPQGAFGTGIHETTRDALECIVTCTKGTRAADIGAGSGVLSIALAKKGMQVTAYDLEPVTREIEQQAALNSVENRITVYEQNVVGPVFPYGSYDLVVINIGADIAVDWLERADSVEVLPQQVVVSGLVDWSVERVEKAFGDKNYENAWSKQTNEWHTILFQRRG